MGYAGAWLIFEEAHITNIAVQAATRGQGVGKALTQGLLQYAANGVILGFTDNIVVSMPSEQYKLRMPTRDNKCKKGEIGLTAW